MFFGRGDSKTFFGLLLLVLLVLLVVGGAVFCKFFFFFLSPFAEFAFGVKKSFSFLCVFFFFFFFFLDVCRIIFLHASPFFFD